MAIGEARGAPLRRWGWYEYAEPRIRMITAEQLGVDAEDLTTDVALADELAADSLDILELGLALEATFGIEIPEVSLEGVRRYGDLVDIVVDLVIHHGGSWPVCQEMVPLRVRLRPAGSARTLERSEWLTPYGVEMIASDAARAGAGAQLDVTVPRGTDAADVTRLEAVLGALANRGVTVTVRTEPSCDTPTPRRSAA